MIAIRSRHRAATGGALLCLVASATGPIDAAEAGSGKAAAALQATLEILSPFTYAGDPLMVRLAVFNTGEQAWSNVGVDLLGGLRVSGAAQGRISLKTKELDAKEQPAMLGPGGFFGVIADIAPLAAGLARPDVITLSWEQAGVTAQPVTVKVIPRFEPAASYVAVMETDFGYLEFDLHGKDAPKHVQNFYDLAHQGFYDGSAVHMVMKGVEFRAGDASTSPVGRMLYTLDQEVAKDRKHARGTLSMMRLPGTNVDDGSQFIVTLGPTPQYDGTLSIFGQIRSGEETLAALESIPTTGRAESPLFRPLKPLIIRSLRVKKADGGSALIGGR